MLQGSYDSLTLSWFPFSHDQNLQHLYTVSSSQRIQWLIDFDAVG